MARVRAGGTTSDFVYTTVGGVIRVASATLTIWSAETGGTQLTDLLLDGNPVTTIPVPSTGQVPDFDLPDGAYDAWASADGGATRVKLAVQSEDAQFAAAVANSTSATHGVLSATYASKPSVSIDLCGAPYNCVPGDDITAELQAAVTAIHAFAKSGEVVISKVGTYLLDGPLQTGTVTVSDPEGIEPDRSYTYAGRVVFPARNFFNTSGQAITIRGPVRPTSGVDQTGRPEGVIIQTTATDGWMFDMIPAQSHWEWKWTGVMPIFQNLVFRAPNNPTVGGLNLEVALRCLIENCSVDTPNWVYPAAGSKEAVVLPHYYNNGDVVMRNVNVRGFPYGIRVSEHCVLDNVNVHAARSAFTSVGGGHSNWFGYVDVENCETIFDLNVPSSHPLIVFGHIDTENANVTGSFNSNTFAKGTGIIQGKIDLNITNAQPWSHGAVGTVMKQLDLANVGQGVGAGWRSLNVEDTFQRLQNVAVTGTAAPGLAWPTLHPWRTKAGGWSVASNRLTGTDGTRNLAIVSPRDPLGSRSVSATVKTGSSGYNATVIACRKYDDDTGIWARLTGGNLVCSVGYDTPFATITGVVAANTTYNVEVAVYFDRGKPRLCKVYLDGVLKVTHTMTSAEVTALTGSTTYPYGDDGVETKDTTSYFTSFKVRDVSLVDDSPSEVRIPASQMMIANGAPSQIASGGVWPCWQLDQSSGEGIVGNVRVPTDWNSCSISVEGYNVAATTGNVVVRAYYAAKAVGDGATSFGGPTDVTVAAGSQNVLQETQIVAATSIGTGKSAFSVRIDRQAADANDTLGNDYAISAVILRRVT